MQRGLCLFAAACLVLVSAAAEPQSRLELRKVALTGKSAPGAEPGLFDEIGTYVDIFNLSPLNGGPTVGTGGGVALVAEHGGDGVPSTRDSAGSGVWRAASGVLEAVALEGDAAPGADGATFTGFPALSAASPGEHVDGVAFAATAFPFDGFEFPGLWSMRQGSLRLLLLQNRPLAGMPAGATASGRFAFVARGPSVLVEAAWCDATFLCAFRFEGLWRDVGSGLQPVVRQGQPAPGFGSGVVFDDLGNTSANTGPVHLWNGSEIGSVIFNGYVRGRRIDSGNNEGLWIEGPLGLALLAREGDKVPGKQGWKWGAASGLRGFGDDTAMRAHILTTNGLALWGASINNRKYNRVNGVWSTRSGAVVQLVQTVRRDGIAGQPPQELATPAPGFGPGHRFRQGGGAAVRQAFELLFTDGSAGVFVGELVSGG